MNCFNELIKFRSFCEANYTGALVESFVEINTIMLAHLANDNELTGYQYGQNLIENATQNVITDISTSAGTLTVNSLVEHLAFRGNFNNLPLSNGGVILRQNNNSLLSKIKVESINVKPLFDGAFIIVLNDGAEYEYPAVAVNGVEQTIPINFETSSKSVQIYAKDTTQLFAKIDATKTTCGSCNNKRYNITAQPIVNKAPSNIYSTVIPTAYLICDAENMLCLSLINPQIKAQIIKAIALQVGINFYNRFMLSNRFNDTTLNVNKDAVETYHNTLVGMYQELMFGVNYATGVAKTNVNPLTEAIKNNLLGQKDICLSCNTIIKSATAIF